MLVFFVSSFFPGLFSSGLMHLSLQTRILSLPATSFLTQKVFKTNFTNTPCDFKNELRRDFKVFGLQVHVSTRGTIPE